MVRQRIGSSTASVGNLVASGAYFPLALETADFGVMDKQGSLSFFRMPSLTPRDTTWNLLGRTRQTGIVDLVVAAYFSLERSSGSVNAGSQALASALVLFPVSAHTWGRGIPGVWYPPSQTHPFLTS